MPESAASSLEQRLLTLYEQATAEEQGVLAALFDMAASADVEVEGHTMRRPSGSTGARSGAELSMIELQSLTAKRATALQLTTGMMNSINSSTKTIAGNIGR